MDAHSESRRATRKTDRRVKCRSVREQGRAGEDASLMRLEDAAVHPFGQTEIIGVHDAQFHAVTPGWRLLPATHFKVAGCLLSNSIFGPSARPSSSNAAAHSRD